MIEIIRSESRGGADHGWLKSKHTFSFADYYDPNRMGFAKLRVINEDWIEPGKGFGTHPHKDMEIVTYMVDGALEHKDSMGNGSVIRAGELQRMTAGTGVTHSEFNHSQKDVAHLLQIWILPEHKGLEPGYEQKLFPAEEKLDQWRLIGSRDGRDGSLTINQDINLSSTIVEASKTISYRFDTARAGFIQIVSGEVELDGVLLYPGDGVAISKSADLTLLAKQKAEILLFDMAAAA
ncbi:MAG: pirin family protein [Pseudomonadota bacterium]